MQLRNPVALAGRLVPEEPRRRWFEPAAADLLRAYAARRRRAHSPPLRRVATLRLIAALLVLAYECRRLERRARTLYTDAPRKGWDPMIANDLRYAIRLLWRSPGFTITAVLAIAIGVGATTALFSIVERVLLRPLPYPEQHRIVDVNETREGSPFAVSAVNLQDWRDRNHTFQALGAYNPLSLTIGSEPPERVDAILAQPELFDVLGMAPILGRRIEPADIAQGAPKVAVLSEGLWRRHFGGDPGIVGRMTTIDGKRRTVIGIMPADFNFPEGTELWLPLILTPDDLSPTQRGAHYLSVVGTVRPGVTIAAAGADLEGIERSLALQFPRQVSEYSVAVTPLLESIVSDVKRPLLILLGAVACLLLIAAMNVSNLLLARATSRAGEMAVRSAVGAARRQIVRQLCTESIVLSLIGGAAGVLLAFWGLQLLVALSPETLPRIGGVALNARVLVFALSLSALTGLLFGVIPATFASRTDLASFLKDGRRGSGGSGARRVVRRTIVALQVGLAVVLLTGAGLALRSFERLTRVDPGFDPGNVLTFDVQLPDGGYPTAAKEAAFFRDYTQRLQAQPGIVAAGAVLFPPLSDLGFGGTVTILGRSGDAAEANMQVRSVTPGYFEAMRIPLGAGRAPAWTDVRGGAGVVFLSQAAVRKYWPGENPIGQHIRIHVSMGVKEQPREVVGIVGDVHVGALDEPAPPVAYVPQDQYASNELTMVVRTPGDPGAAVPTVRSVLRQLDASIAISRVHPMTALTAEAVAAPRFRMVLLTIFACTSLLLAAIGIYGTLAYTVSQRRNEIGLRMALGARAATVTRMIVHDGLTPVVVGLAGGLAAAALLVRVMSALLYGVTALDPLTFAAVAAVLGFAAVVACVVPTRRALAVDPVQTLRD